MAAALGGSDLAGQFVEPRQALADLAELTFGNLLANEETEIRVILPPHSHRRSNFDSRINLLIAIDKISFIALS